MATTLKQLADAAGDKVVQGFVNEMADSSFLLNNLIFDNCISANGTSDLVYGYKRLNTYAEAHFRALGEEPTKSDIAFERVNTNLAILSDAFDIDRVAADAASDLYAEKLTEVKNSIIRGFSKQVVAGDKGSNAFDGLTKILKGKSTEVTGTTALAAVDSKEEALKFASDMDIVLSQLMRDPNVILVSRTTKNKMNAAARLNQ